jgi:ribose transport system permease protein
MTVLFISGGFDMSTGSHSAFLGIILGIMLVAGIPIYLAVLFIILLGIIDGIIIGLIVTKLGVNPFVTTLGFLFIFRGAAILVAFTSEYGAGHSGLSIRNFPEAFLNIGGGDLNGIEYINFYMIVILIIIFILATRNVFFRQSLYVGGSPASARLAGIKTNIVIIFNFTLVSLMVAIATILKVSRINSASATAGGQEVGLSIIAAVIIGGASLRGGSGSVIGSVLGVILISTINNGMVLLGINPFYSQIFVGGILLASVLFDELTRRFRISGLAAA